MRKHEKKDVDWASRKCASQSFSHNGASSRPKSLYWASCRRSFSSSSYWFIVSFSLLELLFVVYLSFTFELVSNREFFHRFCKLKIFLKVFWRIYTPICANRSVHRLIFVFVLELLCVGSSKDRQNGLHLNLLRFFWKICANRSVHFLCAKPYFRHHHGNKFFWTCYEFSLFHPCKSICSLTFGGCFIAVNSATNYFQPNVLYIIC